MELVLVAAEVQRDGSVRLFFAIGGTRASVRMSIARGTFSQAGWDVAEDKVQGGERPPTCSVLACRWKARGRCM